VVAALQRRCQGIHPDAETHTCGDRAAARSCSAAGPHELLCHPPSALCAALRCRCPGAAAGCLCSRYLPPLTKRASAALPASAAVLDTIEFFAAQQFSRVRCESEWRQGVSKRTALCLALSSHVTCKRPPGSSYTQRCSPQIVYEAWSGAPELRCFAASAASRAARCVSVRNGRELCDSNAPPAPTSAICGHAKWHSRSLMHSRDCTSSKNRACVFAPPPFARS